MQLVLEPGNRFRRVDALERGNFQAFPVSKSLPTARGPPRTRNQSYESAFVALSAHSAA